MAPGVAYMGRKHRRERGVDDASQELGRAERCVCALRESGDSVNPEIGVYLNRLSDVLWLMARRAETRVAEAARGIRRWP